MKPHLVRLLSVLLIAALLSCSAGGDFSSSGISLNSLIGNGFNGVERSPARRSLLSLSSSIQNSEHDTALVAALDGTIHLVELETAKVIWSFASGPPIYSSYQAPVDQDNDKENASGAGVGYFVDCGDDWKLYANTILGKVKLDRTPEEFLHITPHIAEDGGVVLGSKKTTVFLVDGKTGRLINTYKLPDHPHTSMSNIESSDFDEKSIEEMDTSGSINIKTDELPLYITRTDYLLASFTANSDKVLWNLTVADIGAAYLCQDVESSFGGNPFDSGYELPSEPDIGFNMPLPCQSRAVVFRLRSHASFESILWPGRLPLAQHEELMLPMPPTNYILPSETKVDKFLEHYLKNETTPGDASTLLLPSRPSTFCVDESLDVHDDNDSEVLLSLPSVTEGSGTFTGQGVERPQNSGITMLSKKFIVAPIIILLIIVGILTYHYSILARKQAELTKQQGNLGAKAGPSKRKKIRKSGKNNNLFEKKEKSSSSDPDDGYVQTRSDNKELLDLNQLSSGGSGGRAIGKLFVSNTEIAKGSNGTVVLEGIYDGRPVAVKRLVKAHHDVAFKEIQNLIASDRHPNIVRWYGVEYDQDFVYLSLERCTCSLYDLIQISDFSEKSASAEEQATTAMIEYKVRLDSVRGIMQDAKLWKENGCPSPILLQLMRDVVSGLVHLHELGIIHRDLKPQNVLIIKEKSLRAKLSDMGISKCLLGDMSSLGHHATGCGSSGWQAPELLLHGRQTRAIDLFSLGCVLFYCITGGRHPFGANLERDINIAKNKVDLFFVEHIPEAVDLFSHLLDPLAELRPKALEVLYHPLFWSSEMRLSFLRDTSDRVELEDREADSDILKALESVAPVGLGGKWDEKMEPAFISNIGRYRRYKFDSVRDLLRVMRNKLNHYRELPREIQELLGPLPEGFDGYFSSRFPKLLIEVYKVMHKYCVEEEYFHKYFKSNVV